MLEVTHAEPAVIFAGCWGMFGVADAGNASRTVSIFAVDKTVRGSE